MTDNTKALVKYRFEQADESLESAKVLFEKNLLRPSVNRSYYAMFYAVQALLATQKLETSKHSGTITFFDREFVKSGVINKDFSRWLHKAFDLRQASDYQADFYVTKEQAEVTLKNAFAFVQEVKAKIIIY
ncbi:MAG TPA: HEPN domain-containing protein [Thermodesulfovibrionia bacterium]|nr:HEPN domain-containing protein [Thermodesulfovibrionia bacterium]